MSIELVKTSHSVTELQHMTGLGMYNSPRTDIKLAEAGAHLKSVYPNLRILLSLQAYDIILGMYKSPRTDFKWTEADIT